MPRELVATAPRTPEIRIYEERPLGPTEIRIRTELASPKHGTELVAYRDDPVATRPYDPALGAVMPAGEDRLRTRFPMPLGNMAVGVVTETGASATRFKVGDRVFGHLSIRETHTVDESRVDLLPEGLSPEAALCLDPVVMAMSVRDGGIGLGDRVAVFGMGAIGLIAVQLARLAGASMVIALDPLENRRELARAFGADVVLDPTADGGDAGLAIRRLTARDDATGEVPRGTRIIGGYSEELTQASTLGVDVAVETSGSIPALQQAIRATAFGGKVCVVSFYGREASGLLLGEEFHINRLSLVSVRSQTLPMREAPRWTLKRMVELSLEWMISGRIRTEGILTPIVPFEESAEAYRAIDERPAESIKLGIRFD
jgi:threonine dehydrogenase-like Zn-dependent dehydrogenase